MKALHKYILLGLSAAFALSCSTSLEKDIPLVKLGAGIKAYTLEMDGGKVDIPVYSNGPYHMEMITKDNDWLTLKMPSDLSSNGYIRAECDFNESFRRQVIFTLCSDVDARRDTVVFRQKGWKEAKLTIDNRSLIAKGAGGEEEYVVDTNIPSSQIEKIVSYSSSDEAATEWIQDIALVEDGDQNCSLKLKTAANPDEEKPRSAEILLKYIDGWGEPMSLLLNVIQRSKNEVLGMEVSMQELKEAVEKNNNKKLEFYYIVEGYVVSSKANRNAGENTQTSPASIDYSIDQRTIYLESMDGTQGICLVASSRDDNITELYDHVKVLLYGTTPVLYDNPSYLVVNNVKTNMFVLQESGDVNSLPKKELHIADLTDDDIFTYVKLMDVEIPVRKGDLMPVNEGYTIASGANRLSKYPRLLRDINGDDMYLYTNSTCMFRNDGTILPYGSGNISGVIVHERYSRFEWENGAEPEDMDTSSELGCIGTYQIRPQVKDDVWKEMQSSVENSFSHLLTEYRFWNPDPQNEVCLPTYGTNGWFTHTYQKRYTGSDSKDFTETTYNQHFSKSVTFDYLGPKGKAKTHYFGRNVGNMNGLGILIDLNKEHWNRAMDDLVDGPNSASPQWCGPNAASPLCYFNEAVYGSINYTSDANVGKGLVPAECYTSFQATDWWDYERNRPYSWLLCFSTAGINTDQLSLQIAVLNTSQQLYAPRYWKLEWSTTDAQEDYNWTEIAQYTVPDVSIASAALYHSVVGFKHINFRLPREMLGQEKVYIRMSPRNDLCSSGMDYADAHLNESEQNAHYSAISYIAVRYN